MDPAVIVLLGEGVKLLVIGMASVFAFLLLLVGVVSAVAGLAARLAPASTVPELPTAGQTSATDPPGQDPRLVVVIAAAIGAYRGRHPG